MIGLLVTFCTEAPENDLTNGQQNKQQQKHNKNRHIVKQMIGKAKDGVIIYR